MTSCEEWAHKIFGPEYQCIYIYIINTLCLDRIPHVHLSPRGPLSFKGNWLYKIYKMLCHNFLSIKCPGCSTISLLKGQISLYKVFCHVYSPNKKILARNHSGDWFLWSGWRDILWELFKGNQRSIKWIYWVDSLWGNQPGINWKAKLYKVIFPHCRFNKSGDRKPIYYKRKGCPLYSELYIGGYAWYFPKYKICKK